MDDNLLKLLYLATIDNTKKWTRYRHDWHGICAQLDLYFEEQLDGEIYDIPRFPEMI